MQFENMGVYSDAVRNLTMQLFITIHLILYNGMAFHSFQADKQLSVKKQLVVQCLCDHAEYQRAQKEV